MPGSSAEVTRTYYRGSARAVRFNVAWQALSVAAHARYVVAMTRLASQHRTHPQALRGVVLVASAATQAGLTVPKEQTDSELVATTRRVFVLGGPVHGVANGVLTAATAAAARDRGLLGKSGVAVGLASAAANLSTPAYFRWKPAGWLIPIGRFSSYLLSGVIGVRLAAWRSHNR